MDYSRNQSYFTGDSAGGCSGCLGIILVIGSFGGFANGDTGAALGALAVGLALLGMSYSASSGSKTISDGEYDAGVARFADGLSRTRALQKLGVDKSEVNEIAPIILGGYEFENADKVKQGKDKRWRSNVYKAIMLFFSRNEFHCYTARFKTTEDNILSEATDVYFYQDIVSASTASVSDKVKVDDDKEIIIHSEAFKLTTKGGTSITVNLLNSRQGQESVNAMRALLREKKQA